MIILGVDPGTATTGFGVVDCDCPAEGGGFRVRECGCIRTRSDLSTPGRLKVIYEELARLIQKHQPQECVVEQLFFNVNVQTAMAVGQARGVVLLAAADFGLDVFEYTPLQVKQALTGYGRARKEQIQYMVKTILGLREVPKPDDAADALALIICHTHYRRGQRPVRNSELGIRN